MLLTSPLTKGLVHKAIFHSAKNIAGTWPYSTPDQMEQMGVVLGKVLNAPSTGTIKYLRGLPASQIVAASAEVRRRINDLDYLAYAQGIDGYVIPTNPPEVYRAHQELPVPLMIGHNALDGQGLVNQAIPPLGPHPTREQTLAAMKSILQVFYGKYPDLLARVLKFYGVNGPGQVSTYPPYGTAMDQLAVDFNHRCSTVVTAEWHTTLAPTWQYEFTRTSPGHPPVHESELRFVWAGLGAEESDESAMKLSDAMETYWTNFAKTGDPNGSGLPAWPKYGATTKQYMDFTSDGPIQKAAMQAGACSAFLEKVTRDPHPLLGNSPIAPGYVR